MKRVDPCGFCQVNLGLPVITFYDRNSVGIVALPVWMDRKELVNDLHKIDSPLSALRVRHRSFIGETGRWNFFRLVPELDIEINFAKVGGIGVDYAPVSLASGRTNHAISEQVELDSTGWSSDRIISRGI